MRPIQRLVRFGAVAAGLSLAGCAPGFGMGPGLQLGVDPAGRLNLGATSCFLTGSGYAPHGMSRTATSAFSFAPRIAQLQARYSLGHADKTMQREGWKQIASGGC